MKKKLAEKRPKSGPSPSKLIDARIRELGDWRGAMLARIRKVIKAADPNVIEEWKWQTPVWSREGIICTGETYARVVKVTFAKGASLKDPKKLFNASLDGNVRRAIDLSEGDPIDEKALAALVRAAVALNVSSATKKLPKKKNGKPAAGKTVLLSGGNPQIAKADGDAPVQAYIAAMPGWKSELGRRLDALVVKNAPGVKKAVRWNSPFYGMEGRGWFLSFHVLTRYVKVTFFNGVELKPALQGGKDPKARWIDIYEGEFDEAQMARWIRQAAALPGWGKN